MPDSHHATHDLELVAAAAAGDATGDGLETATALVATCAECAALQRDLRAIAAALPALPAPARPRDFRLSPEQADSLRPSGIRGLLAAFASPRLRFATPLGTGLAALGIVGVLVASGGLPLAAGGASGGAAVAPVQAPLAGDGAAGMPDASFETRAAAPAVEEAQPQGDTAAGNELAGEVEAIGPASPDADGAGVPADTLAADARPTDQTLFILAGVSLLVGVALVAMRWLARRLT